MLDSIANGLLATLGRFDDALLVIGGFSVLLFGIFISALILIALRRAEAFYHHAPTLLTTFGILGTFLGISTGLLHFDVNNIEASIPLLLNGLKMAFITSITGIFLAVILRLTLVLGPERSGAASAAPAGSPIGTLLPEELTPALVLQHQVMMADAQLAATQQMVEQIAQLDAHLVQTLEQHHAQQLAAFQQFAQQLSEVGSRQLIVALEAVIRDFNTNLGAQFGENFRRLDAAVEKLLQWQEHYRQHLETLGQQLDHALSGVTQSEASLHALTEQTRHISRYIEDQHHTMSELRRESIALEALLSSIAQLRDRADAAFPAVDQRLKQMLDSIETAVISALTAQQRLSGTRPSELTTGNPL
ncbi:hypothetical protein CKO12_04415 [Chromatium okenii]|uniref:hypothetical protein n=1 Tax=Chromatium okenii TaxID=61644 RepID=UPI00190853FE|nr:hypothetical protein [Chromatium okenii]MBK1641127.1 hypothetical protein [Chromatium okenii]